MIKQMLHIIILKVLLNCIIDFRNCFLKTAFFWIFPVNNYSNNKNYNLAIIKINILYRRLLIILFISFSITNLKLYSTPVQSLLSGNKCYKCHSNYQGGGLRTLFGSQFNKDNSTLTTENTFLEDIYKLIEKKEFIKREDTTYQSFWNTFNFGFDFRFQSVRSHKTASAQRRYFPMQASLYLAYNPFDWLTIETDLNFGPKIFRGQQYGNAYIILKSAKDQPMLKIGLFQPSFGIRQCDMTSFDRRIASVQGTESFIAPYYAEPGIEIIYESLDWLTFNAGIFATMSLYEVTMLGEQKSVIPDRSMPSYLFRIIIYPELMNDIFPASYLGISSYINSNFQFYNAFIYFRLLEDIYISSQWAFSQSQNIRRTNNLLGAIEYNTFKGLYLGLRAETALTKYTPEPDIYFSFKANQLVFYAKIMLLPYIEIQPEYRFLGTNEYESTRWSAQIHLFY